jgi:hypothetical protein
MANTIIDGTNTGTIFSISADQTLTISNTTLTNGSGVSGGAVYSNGGTLIMDGAGSPGLTTITNCSAANGGAIYFNQGTIYLVHSFISGCSAAINGGAIYSNGTEVIVESGSINNCLANNGGAIYYSGGSAFALLTIQSGSFDGCSATTDGGGIFSGAGGRIEISESVFRGCSAFDGGVIYSTGSEMTLSNAFITVCSATDGGAIYSTDDTISLLDATSIQHCSATNDGGTIHAVNDAIFDVGSAITNSAATNGNGGGIFADGGSLTVTNKTIGPSGVISFPPQFYNCSATDGGAIYTIGGLVGINGTFFTNSSATSGSGSVIFATGSGSNNVHFSRIYGNSGLAFFADSGSTIDAENNWWGSNISPAGFVSGTVEYNPWLVLVASANPPSITFSQNSAIVASLRYNSNGADTSGTGYMADLIPVTFMIASGNGALKPVNNQTVNGKTTTWFIPTTGTVGSATIRTTVDNQSVNTVISIIPPPLPPTPTPAPHGGGGRTDYWITSGNTEETGYTGPSPTQALPDPAPVPTAQPVSDPVTASATIPQLPTNTPHAGLDAVPTVGALVLCGVIFLFRKDGN